MTWLLYSVFIFLLHQRISLASSNSDNLDLLVRYFKKIQVSDERPMNRGAGSITAVLNDYADKLFVLLHYDMIRKGLDPIELPEELLQLSPLGSVNLTRGWLQDTSTLARLGDIIVSYSAETNKLDINASVKFNDLMFTYDYKVVALFVPITGEAAGKVSNVTVYLSLEFDFSKLEAAFTNFDITNTGDISVTFSGNGLLDWITNSLTYVTTKFLHPIILDIVQYMIKGAMDAFVARVNEDISKILHKNQTTFF